MRAILYLDRVLLREVVEHLLTQVGVEVVSHPADRFMLLTSIQALRPDVVVLFSPDPGQEPGICSHLLAEYPHLKVVMLSTEQYAIADIGARIQQHNELSIHSIHDSLLTLLKE
jgi:DNA-binding NarL/FixJ family response regulator